MALGDVVIALQPGYSISGQVRDTDGAPIALSQIWMKELRQDPLEAGFELGHVVALTDVRGRFRIESVLPGRFGLRADALTHATSGAQEVVVRDASIPDVDFELSVGGEVVGQVFDPEASAVSEVLVVATVRQSDARDAELRAQRRASTDSVGRFTLTGLAAGYLTLSAEHPRLGQTSLGPLPLSAAEKKTVTIQFAKQAASIRGVVRYQDGVAAQGVHVRWYGQPPSSTLTNPAGEFEFPALAPGRGRLKAQVQRSDTMLFGLPDAPDEKFLTLVDGQAIHDVTLIVARHDQAISGVAKAPDGQPLEGVVVGALLETPAVPVRPPLTVAEAPASIVSDVDGRFTISALSRGRYLVWGLHPDFPSSHVAQVQAPARDLSLTFSAGARLSGRVVQADGSPVANYDLLVIPEETAELPLSRSVRGREEGTRNRVNDPAGAFEVAGLHAGRYDVLVTTASGGAGRAAGIDLSEGQSRELLIRLGESVRLRGKVIDGETGQPLPELGVTLTRIGEHVLTRTDANGSFALERLVPGRTVGVHVRGTPGYVSETREVSLSEAQLDHELEPIRLLPMPSSARKQTSSSLALSLKLSQREPPVRILDVAGGSAAEQAGIVPGALIWAIDGRDVSGYGRSAVLALLRGPPKTPVVVSFGLPGGARSSVELMR